MLVEKVNLHKVNKYHCSPLAVHAKTNFVMIVWKSGGLKMALKFNKKWRQLAKDFKKNGRPFHYQYLIRKEEDEE